MGEMRNEWVMGGLWEGYERVMRGLWECYGSVMGVLWRGNENKRETMGEEMRTISAIEVSC